MKSTYQLRWGYPRKLKQTGKRKALRFQQAMQRQSEYNQLTIAQKITIAKSRRGKSLREIAKLEAQL